MNMPLFNRQAQLGDDPEYRALLEKIPLHAQLRAHLEEMWSRFRPLASSHWQSEFPRQTHRRFWEMYLCAALLDVGLQLEPLRDDAPDALVRLPDGSAAWFEAVAADAGDQDNPNSVPPLPELAPGTVHVGYLPEEQMVLRITGVIASKIKQRAKRIGRGRIKAEDAYVIAVNAGAVPHAFAARSDYPLIVRAVFPIGHQYFTVNTASLEVENSGWTSRMGISKKRNPPANTQVPSSELAALSIVPTTLFANDEHAGVSGILYSDATVSRHAAERGGNWGDDFVLIHNPFACNPLPKGIFPRGREFSAEHSNGEMTILRLR
ncbi:hypothetical protein JYK02_33705 [Corallococcus macrosporus]|uniref:Uncharacterized protein n=1 Tax=Corallococcus macrosporus TaxID=35 RepID=A0ABS3DME0_9BACT|nr:hypothetical protein [Corallococcus macrosporus]MBN8232483.1 hypothetical protein [Corallococcus macrosporus]